MSIFKENLRTTVLTPLIVAFFVLLVAVDPSFADDNGSTTQVEEGTIVESGVTEKVIKDETIITEGTEEVEEPTLLPGDFFYFLKTLKESVQLAFTFDEMTEAELLSVFAEERILEATTLFEQGDEENAIETLQLALDQQDEALSKYEEIIEQDTSEVVTKEESIIDGDGTTVEDGGTEEETKVDLAYTELKLKFSSNLLALQATLEKVENPKAKEALAKNVVKAEERLAKKLEKKLAKLEKGPAEEEIEPVEPIEEVESDDNVSEEKNLSDTTIEVVQEEETELKDDSTVQAVTTDIKTPVGIIVQAPVKTGEKKQYTSKNEKAETNQQETTPIAKEAKEKAEAKQKEAAAKSEEAANRVKEAKEKAEAKQKEAVAKSEEAANKAKEAKEKAEAKQKEAAAKSEEVANKAKEAKEKADVKKQEAKTKQEREKDKEE